MERGSHRRNQLPGRYHKLRYRNHWSGHQALSEDSPQNERRTHTFTIGATNVVYTYDEGEKDLFCEGYLALGSTSMGLLGDVNGDGEIKLNDWIRLGNYVKKNLTLSDSELGRADVNRDGKILLNDWIKLGNFVKKNITSL